MRIQPEPDIGTAGSSWGLQNYAIVVASCAGMYLLSRFGGFLCNHVFTATGALVMGCVIPMVMAVCALLVVYGKRQKHKTIIKRPKSMQQQQQQHPQRLKRKTVRKARVFKG